MPFCPICKSDHDLDFACWDRAGAALREAGIEREGSSPEEFEEIADAADNFMLKLFLGILCIIVLFIIFAR